MLSLVDLQIKNTVRAFESGVLRGIFETKMEIEGAGDRVHFEGWEMGWVM